MPSFTKEPWQKYRALCFYTHTQNLFVYLPLVRKPLLITILIVTALATITWLFSSRSGKKDLTPWQLVPPQALAVIETQKPRILEQLNADSSNLVALLVGNDTTNTSPDPWLFSIQSLGPQQALAVIERKKSATLQ